MLRLPKDSFLENVIVLRNTHVWDDIKYYYTYQVEPEFKNKKLAIWEMCLCIHVKVYIVWSGLPSLGKFS